MSLNEKISATGHKKAIQKTNQEIDSVLDGDNPSKLRGRCEVFAEELKAQHHGGPTLYKCLYFLIHLASPGLGCRSQDLQMPHKNF